MLAGQGGARAIGERHLADILSRAEAANRGEPITFFEITTAAAFVAFAENPADVVLLEQVSAAGSMRRTWSMSRSPRS